MLVPEDEGDEAEPGAKTRPDGSSEACPPARGDARSLASEVALDCCCGCAGAGAASASMRRRLVDERGEVGRAGSFASSARRFSMRAAPRAAMAEKDVMLRSVERAATTSSRSASRIEVGEPRWNRSRQTTEAAALML